jgi:predicted DsbA family dithiol-disulfide isomerase
MSTISRTARLDHAVRTREPAAAASGINIEIWSDNVCAWCYIGKRRLERALADFPHRDRVTVTWRAFELDPTADKAAMDLTTFAARRRGISEAAAEDIQRSVEEIAAAEGLDMKIRHNRKGNTFDTHRLLHLALARGIQDQVQEALLKAHFTDQRSLFERASLTDIAVEAGLERDEVTALLDDEARFADAVRKDEATVRAYGATGAPFFVIDGRYALSGAQSPEVIREVLDTAWNAKQAAAPVRTVSAGGATCGPDGCSA